jgi:predicted Zn-dependent protease
LANAYFLAGRHSDAEEIYVRLAARYPNEPKFVYNLAEAYFAKKDIDNAYPLFQRVVSMSDQLPNAYLRLISCMEHKNQPDDALRLVDQLLERPCVPELKSQLEVERKRIGFHAHLKHNNGAVSMEDIQKCFGAPQGSEAAGNTVQA